METIKLDLIPGKKMPSLHASQFDDGREHGIDLFENGVVYKLDGTETLTINERKGDDCICSLDIENTFADSNHIVFASTEQMCAVWGNNICELVIAKGEKTIGTLNFILEIEPSPTEGGIESESEISNLERQITEITEQVIGDDYYTADQTDEAIATAIEGKADKTYVDTELDKKADKTNTYTKNEIDEIVYEDLSYPNLWTDTDESYTGTGVSWSRNKQDYIFEITTAGANKGRFFKLDLDVSDHIGEDITISAILDNYNTTSTPTVRFNCIDSENNAIYGATEYQFTLSTSQRKSKTMPIPQGAKYVVFGLYSGTSSSAVGKTWTVSNIQIEWGDQATEYHVKGDYKASKIEILEDETEDLDERVDKLEEYHFPYEYNERIYTNGRFRNCYNPYKDGGSLQLKGQMHCHCTSNDGTVLSTPAQIYNNYKLLYDFMVLTDYNFTSDFTRFDDLVELNDLDPDYDLIQLCKGYELKVVGEGSVKQYHMILWNPDVIVDYNAGTKPQIVIDEMAQKGCVVDFPHPTYSNYSARDMMNINVKFIEVISGTSLSENQWDALLSAGKLSFGMGVSDCHGTSVASIDSAWIKVFSNQKNREDIFKSLLAGNFYASNGATINKIEIVDNELIIDTGDPLATVVFTKENGTVLATETGAVVSYSFAGNEKYVRAKITLSDSSIAWTQPIFFSNETDKADLLDYFTKEQVDSIVSAAVYSVLPTDSASGPIANFTTSLELPIKSLEIDVNAVQESGTPTPATPLPISGWSAITLDVNGDTEVINLGGTYYGGHFTQDKAGHRQFGDTYSGLVNLSDLTFNPTTKGGHTCFYADLPNGVIKSGGEQAYLGKCSTYTVTSNLSLPNDLSCLFYCSELYGGYTRILIRDDSASAMTGAQFTAYVTGQICYEKANPQTINLPDGEPIITLNGTNNIYADTGDTEVVFKSSVNDYVSAHSGGNLLGMGGVYLGGAKSGGSEEETDEGEDTEKTKLDDPKEEIKTIGDTKKLGGE